MLQNSEKECALAHSCAEARLLRQPSTLAPSAHPRGAFFIARKRSFPCDKKECALAHSCAEARLLRQPSTLAPSAHPRGAFFIARKRSFPCDKKRIRRQTAIGLCAGFFFYKSEMLAERAFYCFCVAMVFNCPMTFLTGGRQRTISVSTASTDR